MTISERIAAARRERRVLTRVSRAAWRLDQAGRERTWALVSARAEGISIRTLATAIGLSPSRVHQIVADAHLDAVIAALGELRATGWPAPPKTPAAMRTPTWTAAITSPTACRTRWTGCGSARAGCGSARAGSGSSTGAATPPAVSLRPSAGWPDRAVVTADLARVQAVIDRIAADVDELARAWRAGDLDTPAVLPTGGRSAAGGWPSRTWSSGPSAPAGDCPPHQPCNWSGPGTPGRPNGTGAARSASGRATPAARSGHADHPPACPRSGNWTP